MAKSNKAWLRRHVTDGYVQKSRQQGYRSRAAFKLLELDEKERFLRRGARVLDLGAAPGGWSQLAAGKGAAVTAVDLLPMAPIPGVTILQGDFREVLKNLPGFDVVLSDLSPNISGIRNVDQARILELLEAAIGICKSALRSDGVFVSKAFHGEAFDEARAALEKAFLHVRVFKPAASRGESRETYFIARGVRDSTAASPN